MESDTSANIMLIIRQCCLFPESQEPAASDKTQQNLSNPFLNNTNPFPFRLMLPLSDKPKQTTVLMRPIALSLFNLNLPCYTSSAN